MTDSSTLLIERRWNSHPRNVQCVRESLRDILFEYAGSLADLVELAIGEACANAIEHGSPAGDDNFFTVRCAHLGDPQRLIFEVEDEGCDFNVTRFEPIDVPDLDSESGRGLFIMNSIMDELTLHSTPHGLVVRMVKCCDDGASLLCVSS